MALPIAVISPIVDKFLGLMTRVFDRLFDSETKREVMKLVLEKNTRKAHQIAEQNFLNFDIEWLDLMFKGKLEKNDEKHWDELRNNYENNRKQFFRLQGIKLKD